MVLFGAHATIAHLRVCVGACVAGCVCVCVCAARCVCVECVSMRRRARGGSAPLPSQLVVLHVPVLVGQRRFIAGPVEPVVSAGQLERKSEQRPPSVIHPVRVRVRVGKDTMRVRAILAPGLWLNGQRAADSDHAAVKASARCARRRQCQELCNGCHQCGVWEREREWEAASARNCAMDAISAACGGEKSGRQRAKGCEARGTPARSCERHC